MAVDAFSYQRQKNERNFLGTMRFRPRIQSHQIDGTNHDARKKNTMIQHTQPLGWDLRFVQAFAG